MQQTKTKLFILVMIFLPPMASTVSLFQCNKPFVLMDNRVTIGKNGSKTNHAKTKTPFPHHKKLNYSSMKSQACLVQPSQLTEKQYFKSKIKQVNEALDQSLPLEHPTRIHEPMRYSLMAPGKRFRPALCLASCKIVGGDESQAMPLACALEMIQTMSLIVDDLPCIDNDPVRRGMPANHKVFSEGTTVLAGHSLICLAFQHIAERTKNIPAERIVRAIAELAYATGYDGLLGGQLEDLHCEGQEVSLSKLKYISVQKTAKLIEAPLVCGAIIGGGSEEEIERLRRYGRHIGVMYQVVNDILDLTKSSEELGKMPKIDLVSDKATYPKFMGIEGAKRYVHELKAQAMQQLSTFPPTKVSPFYYLTNYIVNQLN